MKELLKRIFSRPVIAFELITATLFLNTLAMASSLFVMLVLNRYVSQGVDATLMTLTTGVLIAIVLEFAFRQARMALARGINVAPDERAALSSFAILTRARAGALEQVPPETRREMVNGMAAVENAYSASNISTVLDVPFSLIFVLVLYFFHPIIALIALSFILAVFALGLYGSYSMKDKTAELQNAQGTGSALIGTATREQDLIRSFNAGSFLRDLWKKHTHHAQGLRRDVGERQALIQTITQSANGVLTVVVIAVGAILVVRGDMDVGLMIGANILASRAMQPVAKFSQLGSQFAKARQAIDLFREMVKVPLEPESGSAASEYKGGLEFRDTAFTFPGASGPIFESLNLTLEPGDVLLVVGDNGSGKTTFARLILGLLEPSRGQVLIDGLDLKQVALEWWRQQIIYMPQEPSLLNATIEENLKINAPDAELSDLNQIIDATGLRKFLDESEQSFETPIVDNGWRLSEGTRRRLGLARALATNGRLAVIDEPTESLDADGCAAVHRILGNLVKDKRTIILMSHDRDIVRGAHYLLDLNEKPVPTLRHVPGVPQGQPQGQPQAQSSAPQRRQPKAAAGPSPQPVPGPGQAPGQGQAQAPAQAPPQAAAQPTPAETSASPETEAKPAPRLPLPKRNAGAAE